MELRLRWCLIVEWGGAVVGGGGLGVQTNLKWGAGLGAAASSKRCGAQKGAGRNEVVGGRKRGGRGGGGMGSTFPTGGTL